MLKKIEDIEYLSPPKNITTIKESLTSLDNWDEEKSNLLLIMDQNEKLLRTSYDNLIKEKQNLAQEYQYSEKFFRTQLVHLSEENQLFKKEIERLNSKITNLSCRLEDSTAEFNKKNAENISLLHSKNEVLKVNSQLQEKLRKNKISHKEKEDCLKAELEDLKEKYGILESEFEKKLEGFMERLNPSKKNPSKATQDQLKNLVAQKKTMENDFLQEKKKLVQESSDMAKKIRALTAKYNGEKTRSSEREEGFIEKINILTEKNYKLTSENRKLLEKMQEKDNEYREMIESANFKYNERESQYLESVKTLETNIEEYKKSSEKLKKQKIDDLTQETKLNYEKVKGFKDEIVQAVETLLNVYQEETDKNKNFNTNSGKNIGRSTLILDFKKCLKAIENETIKIEKIQEDFNSFFNVHTEAITNKEKENIQYNSAILNENTELNLKLNDFYSAHFLNNNGKSKSPRDLKGSSKSEQIIKDLTETNKKLLQKIKAKISSNEKKQLSEYNSWEIREKLYKKNIKSLRDQVISLTLQLSEIKKFQKQDLEKLLLKDPDILKTPEETVTLHKDDKFTESIQILNLCLSKLHEFESNAISFIKSPST